MATVIQENRADGGLEAALDRHCKTFSTRNASWRVWGFETQVDKKFARSQRRYLGTSGNVDHDDPNALMGASFTLSVLEMPPGHEQPMHNHPDEEEVFFVLKGRPTVVWQRDGETVTRQLGPWDMVYNPPGQVHCIRNDSDEDCFFQVILGNPKPARPLYADPELRRLQEGDNPDTELRGVTA